MKDSQPHRNGACWAVLAAGFIEQIPGKDGGVGLIDPAIDGVNTIHKGP